MSGYRPQPEVTSGAALEAIHCQTQDGKRPSEPPEPEDGRASKRRKVDDYERKAQMLRAELEATALKRSQVQADLEAARSQIGSHSSRRSARDGKSLSA
ncbi:hypothetical protein AURDEDRAFT_166060 [Auricularia subglabra TFB-10046 SS5]|nr:hypothetical protein AURDEDRAFT_166060 [Auricularia subglabra TFB-10046 SS5]